MGDLTAVNNTSREQRPIWSRIRGYYERRSASFVFKKPFNVHASTPLISFTFDDFPKSALFTGGKILNEYGLSGTYYACLGLMGEEIATGKLFEADDVHFLLERGHELGCHTFSHSHSWNTDTRTFEQSVRQNAEALDRLIPGARFETFSYPISQPRPLSKARIASRFECCRAGGQTFNAGLTDLNQLSAFFLEKSRDDFASIAELIRRNNESHGWLVLATHDVSDQPTPYGCTPQFFRDVIKFAVSSGARVLPVARALQSLRENDVRDRL